MLYCGSLLTALTRGYCSCFIDMKTEAEKDWITCPWSHCCKRQSWDSNLCWSDLKAGKLSLFFKRFYCFLFLPKAPRYIVVYSSLWVLLVVACGVLPQRGLMSSAMSAPRIRTNKTLGRLKPSEGTQPLGPGASPSFSLNVTSWSLGLGWTLFALCTSRCLLK